MRAPHSETSKGKPERFRLCGSSTYIRTLAPNAVLKRRGVTRSEWSSVSGHRSCEPRLGYNTYNFNICQIKKKRDGDGKSLIDDRVYHRWVMTKLACKHLTKKSLSFVENLEVRSCNTGAVCCVVMTSPPTHKYYHNLSFRSLRSHTHHGLAEPRTKKHQSLSLLSIYHTFQSTNPSSTVESVACNPK